MKRRRFLTGASVGIAVTLAGCAGDDEGDDEGTPVLDDADDADEKGTTGVDDADDSEDSLPDEEDDGFDSDEDWEPHAPSGAGVSGRIDPLGHTLGDERAFYSFADVSPDGTVGVIGAHAHEDQQVASTLVDLSELDSPAVVHHLDAANGATRCNDVKVDPGRDGLYYRAQEANDLGSSETQGERGIEVVDFGWGDGTPEEPEVIADVEILPNGVHKLTTHPDEEVLYLVDLSTEDVGVITVDVSEPDDPEIIDEVGPPGGCHDVEYDPVREVIHAAYMLGETEGYVIYDASDPYQPEPIGEFLYDDQPNYDTLGEPGFELCHQADYDPERDLAVVGDELRSGVPGGKHVFDIGWDEGSLTEPEPIGFTHSPDAREMGGDESYWWTTHFHDVVPMDSETLLVDGGYRQGVWVCNITDPREPVPTERYATVEGAEELPREGAGWRFDPPFAWGAVYNEAREFVLASDSFTGVYTMRLSSETARGERGRGPDGHYDIDAVLDRADDSNGSGTGKHDH